MVNASSQWAACADVHYLLQTRPVVLLWFNQNVDLTIFSSIKSKIIWWRRLLLDFVTKGSKYLVVWGAVDDIVMYQVQPKIKSWGFSNNYSNYRTHKTPKIWFRVVPNISLYCSLSPIQPNIWNPLSQNPKVAVTHHYWAFGYVLGLILLDDHESSEWVYYIQHQHAHTHIIYHPSFWEYCIKLRFCLY